MNMKQIVIALTVLTATGAIASNSGQYYQQMKPWTLSVGIPFWQGDHKDAGIDNGFLVSLDYQYQQGGGAHGSFIGVRMMLGESGGVESRTMGVHYGASTGFGGGAQNLYLKTAGGYYNTDVDGAGDEWGFGGFVALGYMFGGGGMSGMGSQGLSLEVGWFWAPSTGGVDNNGFYAAAGIKF